jgi:molecular chaperone GrpE
MNQTSPGATPDTQASSESEEPVAVEAELIDNEEDAEAGSAVDAHAEDQQDEAPASPEDMVAAAQAEAAEWQGKYLRLHAEWDTYRRRMNEQRDAEKLRAAERLVGNLIPVLDDFERTIEFASQNGEAELLEGVRAVHTKFVDALVKDGVEIINPAGEAFNALEAQAVATVPNPQVPDETVAEVYQKGYKLGVKVIRPAMVTVTTGGPARERTQDSNQ